MRGLVLSVILVFLVSGLIGCSIVETSPTQVTKIFAWTATGDDNLEGTAAEYEFRYSTDSATLVNDWDNCMPANCTQIIGPPLPAPAGSAETFVATMTLETEVVYYFGMRTADEVSNWSLTSNIISLRVPDSTPPLAVSDLKFL
uniref:Fibronectin type-III domain-containing protein n=1 Tax=viral metagenome TaxID=1070528 RepID=A0A6M3LMM5_9ZZZZ